MQLPLFDAASVQHNVFFALQPDVKAATQIGSMARDLVERRCLAARFLPPERLHVSLVAVGGFDDPLPPTIIDTAKSIAATISMAPFGVAFDRVASFGGKGGQTALVLMGGAGVAGLVALHDALSLALAKVGIGVRRSRPFTPHLTMAYADRTPEGDIEPLLWTASEFVLIDSLVGQSRHAVLGRWPLKA